MELEFLSLLILIVYIGAISVLFLFSVMLFNLKEVVKTKNNNLILKSFFFIFIIFLFLYVLALFSITFQKNLDFLIFLIDYDFLYYENRIIYTFFDQKNEILNFIFITLEEVSHNFTIQNNIFLYTNIVSNINNDLYILGHSIYDFYIIYLILTGLILLIGMYGAISLINNQKPIMQLQHMNRQISTSLVNRTINFVKEITTFDIIIDRIITWNFSPFTSFEHNIIFAKNDDFNYEIYFTIISLFIFFGTLLWKYKKDVMFVEMILDNLLSRIIVILLIYIGFTHLTDIRLLRMAIQLFGLGIFILTILYLQWIKKKAETYKYLTFKNYDLLTKAHKKCPSVTTFVTIHSESNKLLTNPEVIEVNISGKLRKFYPLYLGHLRHNGNCISSYAPEDEIDNLNIKYRCVIPSNQRIEELNDFHMLFIILMTQPVERLEKGVEEILAYLRKVATPEEYSNYTKNPGCVTLLLIIYNHLYIIKDINTIIKSLNLEDVEILTKAQNQEELDKLLGRFPRLLKRLSNTWYLKEKVHSALSAKKYSEILRNG
jgi:NADH:ubiquinone oxidoreductase subunit 6 (subunit J)